MKGFDSKDWKVNLLNIAAFNNDIDMAKFLVSKGAEVNSFPKDNNYSPLHAAAYAGNIEMVQYLLSVKADPYLKNRNGKTAADVATCRVWGFNWFSKTRSDTKDYLGFGGSK